MARPRSTGPEANEPAKPRATKKPARVRKPRSPLPRERRPPRDATRDLFLVWRMPRLGFANPHDMTNPVWAWLARHPELSAYQANAHFDGPSSLAVGPCWCNARFGQSRTSLPDGRIVAIGGEHEDHYDPDFCIYNDVIVTEPSGELRIYGYPTAAFPPTDFHSATLAGDRIVIIGCLGHPRSRIPDATPVHVLDTRSFAIEPRATIGPLPGWIFGHRATLTPDERSVVVSGGERIVSLEGEQHIAQNIDDWSLDLEHWTWTRASNREWQEWSLHRTDGRPNDLFSIQSMKWQLDARMQEMFDEAVRERGGAPDFALYDARYAPPIAHETLPQEEERYDVHRIVVGGVTIRYLEHSWEVRVLIEGALPQETIHTVLDDVLHKLERLDSAPYRRRRLQ